VCCWQCCTWCSQPCDRHGAHCAKLHPASHVRPQHHTLPPAPAWDSYQLPPGWACTCGRRLRLRWPRLGKLVCGWLLGPQHSTNLTLALPGSPQTGCFCTFQTKYVSRCERFVAQSEAAHTHSPDLHQTLLPPCIQPECARSHCRRLKQLR
jgi:hypothetical protein